MHCTEYIIVTIHILVWIFMHRFRCSFFSPGKRKAVNRQKKRTKMPKGTKHSSVPHLESWEGKLVTWQRKRGFLRRLYRLLSTEHFRCRRRPIVCSGRRSISHHVLGEGGGARHRAQRQPNHVSTLPLSPLLLLQDPLIYSRHLSSTVRW